MKPHTKFAPTQTKNSYLFNQDLNDNFNAAPHFGVGLKKIIIASLTIILTGLLASPAWAITLEVPIGTISLGTMDLMDRTTATMEAMLIIGLLVGLFLLIFGLIKLMVWRRKPSPTDPQTINLIKSRKVIYIVLSAVGVFIIIFCGILMVFIGYIVHG